jgi:hypothetical protein
LTRAGGGLAQALGRIEAVGLQSGRDALVEHPLQHGSGIRGELQLQQLLPHLLLAAAQVHHVAGESVGARHEEAAEAQEGVHGGGHRRAAPDQVAQVDQAVAVAQAAGQFAVQAAQRLGLAVNGGNRPDAVGTATPDAAQNRELLPIPHSVGAQSSNSWRPRLQNLTIRRFCRGQFAVKAGASKETALLLQARAGRSL